ncbi:GMC family oxidoreductase [Mycobacterium sp. E3198]|uniref:GMC family oxidoreductase n=1 Tax=Mycobacterium sp. E3198 TaxID=1834143 RepID=UPI0008002D05|nr:GMC family oxidoreductase N-terminal domain-containing protein [Mycobacterium sp. E3198]OBG31711.1 glucose-methanol-choline oxidoreductase [Mycobacterium sp. E3198]
MDADFVVVGTGSAGSVLANRLGADPPARVVVLEAGPLDKDKFVHIPAGWPKLFRGPRDWNYLTEPQQELAGREIYWPRGKMLGGSSSMNAMMWVPGYAADYDDWAVHAGSQWSFANVKPYFDRIENGPLHICAQRSPRRSTAAWLAAAAESGFRVGPPTDEQPEGFCEARVTQRRGARCSTADAYLRPALRRGNVSLLTGAMATRVMIERGRAVGIEFSQDGQRRVVAARREVVLCAGAVNTPQLLMLSGIGDRDQLSRHGIEVIHHSPEVGQNLLDHLFTPLVFAVIEDTLFTADKPANIANYFLRRRGLLTSNCAEAYGMIRSDPKLRLPDVELLFSPGPFLDEGLGVMSGHAVTMGAILLQPKSRGQITLRSADVRDKPVIDPRYLSDPEGLDRATLMTGLRACATLAGAPPLRRLLGGIERPHDARALDEETLARALEMCSHTLYHPVGTARMGVDGSSVVDPDLRVRGVAGLRVADASVMPTIIRGHTHAPSVLIGEKAADLIRR